MYELFCALFRVFNPFIKYSSKLTPHPGDWYDEEGAPAAGLDDDCEELWVDGAERRVPAPLRYPDVVEALLSLEVGPVDVAELGGADHAERHSDGVF